jgi:hypothetical protein
MMFFLFLALREGSLPRVPQKALREYFFHWFLGLPTLFTTPCYNLEQFWILLVYFINLFFSLNFLNSSWISLETTFPACCSSWYDNKMLKNLCEFLDTASIYTKYHEYQFESPNYIISCTCNANFKYAKNSTKRKKHSKYTKRIKITPNLNEEFQIMWNGLGE